MYTSTLAWLTPFVLRAPAADIETVLEARIRWSVQHPGTREDDHDRAETLEVLRVALRLRQVDDGDLLAQWRAEVRAGADLLESGLRLLPDAA